MSIESGERGKVKRFKRQHNGVEYLGVEDRLRTVVGSITKGDKKWTLTGFPKINKTNGSYKHGDEIQITIWNKAGTTYEKDRVRYELDGRPKLHAWDTVEIFFSPEVWHELIKEYYRYINEAEWE